MTQTRTLNADYHSYLNYHAYQKGQVVEVEEIKGNDHSYAVRVKEGHDRIPKSYLILTPEACIHKNVTVVYTEGKALPNGGHEKDLLVSCTDCPEELYRLSAYGRNVVSLIPTF